MNGCNVTSLDFANELKNLRELQVKDTKVNGQALDRLSNASLRSIYLENLALPFSSIESLMTRMFNLLLVTTDLSYKQRSALADRFPLASFHRKELSKVAKIMREGNGNTRQQRAVELIDARYPNPPDELARVLYVLGTSTENNLRPAEQLSYLQRAMNIAKNSKDPAMRHLSHLMATEFYLLDKNRPKADAEARAFSKIAPTDPKVLQDLGKTFMRHDKKTAVRYLKQHLQSNHNEGFKIQSQCWLALCYKQLQRNEEARDSALKVVTELKDRTIKQGTQEYRCQVEAVSLLAELCEVQERLKEAQRWNNMLIRIMGKNYPARIILTQLRAMTLHFALNENAQGIALGKKVLQRLQTPGMLTDNQNNAYAMEFLLRLAEASLKENDPEQSLRWNTQAEGLGMKKETKRIMEQRKRIEQNLALKQTATK